MSRNILILFEVYRLCAYLSGFSGIRIGIFLYLASEVIADYRIAGTVVLSGWVCSEYRYENEVFAILAERIGFAQFVNLFGVSLVRPMVERIIILVHRSIIIHALEEGVVGRNGEGAHIFMALGSSLMMASFSSGTIF